MKRLKEMPGLFGADYARGLDEVDPLAGARKGYCLPRGRINFCVNSLGLQPKRTPSLVNAALKQWRTFGVTGHFTKWPETGTGYSATRDAIRPLAAKLIGARENEVAIIPSITDGFSKLLLWLLHIQLSKRRKHVIFDQWSFPSDKIAFEWAVSFMKAYTDVKVLDVPRDPNTGLIDHDRLERLITSTGERLALVVIGNGGVDYRTGQVLELGRISRAASRCGAKSLYNLAHMLGNVEDLHLSRWLQGACAVLCTYKFAGAGPGASGIAFIHSSIPTDKYPFVGWFSVQEPLRLLAEPSSGVLRTNAQRMESSNADFIGLIPLLAALRELLSTSKELVIAKNAAMSAYFDSLMAGIQSRFGNPIEMITPSAEYRSNEIIFTTVDASLAKRLHQFVLDQGIEWDIRDKKFIRVGMSARIHSYNDIRTLFVAIWKFFATQ